MPGSAAACATTRHRPTVRLLCWSAGVFLFIVTSETTTRAESSHKTEGSGALITMPSNGEAVHGICQMAISIPGLKGITHVAVYRDGALLTTDFAAPYDVSWDTRRELEGAHTLVARAVGSGVFEASPEITVTVDNTPPRVAVVEPREGTTLGGAVELGAEASDALGIRQVSFLIDGVEVGAVSRPPFRLRWDSRNAPTGRRALQAQAADRAGNVATSDSVWVQLANLNDPPIMTPIGPQDVKEDETLTLVVSALDPDGARDALTFRASNLPPWAEFRPKSREFSGTPDHSVATWDHPTRVYAGVRFEVCDPQPLCSHEDVTISVHNVNCPPEVEPLRDRVIKEQEAIAITLVASDPDGDPLDCTAKQFPSWAAFDRSTCTLQGVPGLGESSHTPGKTDFNVTLETCDPDHLCASDAMVITVIDVTPKPVWDSIPEQRVDEGSSLRFTVRATDPDNDPLRLTLHNPPFGSTFTDHGNGTGTFAWTPRVDQAGTYEVAFAVSDGKYSVENPGKIVVRERRLAISGFVRTDAGLPVEGAIVEFIAQQRSVLRVKTDAEGFYLVDTLPPGTYKVKPHYEPSREFSPVARKFATFRFSPLYRDIILSDHDHVDVHFVGTAL